MRYKVAISLIVGSMLALTSVVADADQGRGGSRAGSQSHQMDRSRDYDRDRIQDRTRMEQRDQDQVRDQVREQDRIHQTDPMKLEDKHIYGSALMTEQERNQYRKQLSQQESVQARERFQTQHEEKMQQRAMEQGKDLVPPGQGPVYGGELMTVQERNAYREQLWRMETKEEREKFMTQHREKIQERAKAIDTEVEEAE